MREAWLYSGGGAIRGGGGDEFEIMVKGWSVVGDWLSSGGVGVWILLGTSVGVGGWIILGTGEGVGRTGVLQGGGGEKAVMPSVRDSHSQVTS